jgi:hypothetical protein
VTATAVSPVPRRMAGAGNDAFRLAGGSLGLAVMGALLATKATDALPGHLTDAGVTGATAQRVMSAVDAGGLGAVSRLDLGADTPRAMAAVARVFLDGLHQCMIVSAALTLLAAAAAVLLRRPQPATAPGSGTADHGRPRVTVGSPRRVSDRA